MAYAVEALAQLSKATPASKEVRPTGIHYCRTCYDHLAGFVGVQLVETMEHRGYLKKADKQYLVTKRGWEGLKHLDIKQTAYENIRRPIARQCLDWSVRRPHLAGQDISTESDA